MTVLASGWHHASVWPTRAIMRVNGPTRAWRTGGEKRARILDMQSSRRRAPGARSLHASTPLPLPPWQLPGSSGVSLPFFLSFFFLVCPCIPGQLVVLPLLGSRSWTRALASEISHYIPGMIDDPFFQLIR